MSEANNHGAMTIPALLAMKQRGERIAALTAYDASMARLADRAGVDLVLVGDSLGMVIQGHASTLPVRLEDVAYHTAAVRRGLERALLVADLPFLSYPDRESAFLAARRLIGECGAAMLKLEGAGYVIELVAALVEREVPVCGHLGLTPQSVLRLGGYRLQAREEDAQRRLAADALALVEAGISALVLECVPSELARRLARELPVPVIGIGAGPGCDGQILVSYDLLGISPGRRPRFCRDFLAGRGSVSEAFAAYVRAVKEGDFPSAAETLA
ncbi:MAG: 3-methyl-2-oxobutanoate hydroxymethyltransferase [Lysobacterales bacterium]|jgi:3-methyl-2-oxobutanoate hydroxymethyltransferase|nr:MAG: 3-methyl-2-oxobutanoate hydroxymethyltransferase [Xanthomonadales bacterium]